MPRGAQRPCQRQRSSRGTFWRDTPPGGAPRPSGRGATSLRRGAASPGGSPRPRGRSETCNCRKIARSSRGTRRSSGGTRRSSGRGAFPDPPRGRSETRNCRKIARSSGGTPRSSGGTPRSSGGAPRSSGGTPRSSGRVAFPDPPRGRSETCNCRKIARSSRGTRRSSRGTRRSSRVQRNARFCDSYTFPSAPDARSSARCCHRQPLRDVSHSKPLLGWIWGVGWGTLANLGWMGGRKKI